MADLKGFNQGEQGRSAPINQGKSMVLTKVMLEKSSVKTGLTS